MDLSLVFKQGDPVLIAVFLILILMSVITWTVIIVRALKLFVVKGKNKKALFRIWASKDMSEVEAFVRKDTSTISNVAEDGIDAMKKHTSTDGNFLGREISLDEFVGRGLRNSIKQTMRRFEGGLTALASIGATAPFIGLFGTVWGIYHALINISAEGQMSIAAVAGPIGEALVATAAGLFVAIPAVLVYNALVRSNKTLQQDLDAFAHDFYPQIISSAPKHCHPNEVVYASEVANNQEN
ncbi:MotA/TolQ/ExbB proton channel family protein [Taylorella equigenitalis]|uniref:MotA/TolQ/ExbB proton channel family protein n=1 Tax=Taylorella equigenitalis TaxID=29575 RepID=UPI00237E5313|nr:MotA/TolQ/ExbB proton channel family protein [Taylorella equigenitalis]WDU48528.1 MotA/TolQ/ExbB proton channel family protein [Taylorella equigenitalis]